MEYNEMLLGLLLHKRWATKGGPYAFEKVN